MENLKNKVLSREFNNTFNGDQLRDLRKETKIGSGLCIMGCQLESMDGVLTKLEKLDSSLTKVEHSDWRIFNWALQLSMVALLQH